MADNNRPAGTPGQANAAYGADQGQNKLGSWPIGKLLLSMAIPMMLSFFIQALYNFVDSMFVARISENALTAVSLAYPVQNIMMAIGVGTGVGISASVPRAIGRGDMERADRIANSAVFINIVWSVLFAVLGFIAARGFYLLQTDIPDIVDGGTIYLRICWGAGFGLFFSMMFERLLVATGYATLAMIAQASGAVFNIIFDPLLIFGIGPFPRMGIAGAATATVLGQIFAAVIALLLNLKKNSNLRFSLNGVLHPDFGCIRQIYSIGFPSMITIGLSSLTGFCINIVLLGYSTTATAVYGIWMKLMNFCFMPAFGLNNALVPILSFNYGKRDRQRVKSAIRLALTIVLVFMLTLTVILELIPRQLLMLFSASDNMMSIGLVALRICCISLVFGAATIVMTSSMQSMDHSRYTLIVNLMRQFVILVPAFFLLSFLTHDLNKVWFAVPLSEMISCCTAVILYRKMDKDIEAEFAKSGN
ncbi:MAG: MATE family efflux transporter [Lachnospiraceae bacterium]|nr:MATE family efflux transporter [Lachnospiraceae bacterium]